MPDNVVHMWPLRAGGPAHLVGIDAVVDGPGGLEVLQHALLELLGQAVDADKVLQVLHSRVVEGAAGVHALDDRSHVAKDQGVHQSCGGRDLSLVFACCCCIQNYHS